MVIRSVTRVGMSDGVSSGITGGITGGVSGKKISTLFSIERDGTVITGAGCAVIICQLCQVYRHFQIGSKCRHDQNYLHFFMEQSEQKRQMRCLSVAYRRYKYIVRSSSTD